MSIDPKTQEKNRLRFNELLSKVQRPGMKELLDFISKTDFYTAPSSTRFHLSVEGGLLQHSLNVYDALVDILHRNEDGTYSYVINGRALPNKTSEGVTTTISEDKIIVMSLLHDLCKIGTYKKEKRNKKNEETGQWEKVDVFVFDDQIPYGHGEKSVILLQEYIKLDAVEKAAIRWHMGYSNISDSQERNILGAAVKKYPVVWALHEADMHASSFMESNEGNI